MCTTCKAQGLTYGLHLRNESYYLIISKAFLYDECYNSVIGVYILSVLWWGRGEMEKIRESSHKCVVSPQRAYSLEGKSSS